LHFGNGNVVVLLYVIPHLIVYLAIAVEAYYYQYFYKKNVFHIYYKCNAVKVILLNCNGYLNNFVLGAKACYGNCIKSELLIPVSKINTSNAFIRKIKTADFSDKHSLSFEGRFCTFKASQ